MIMGSKLTHAHMRMRTPPLLLKYNNVKFLSSGTTVLVLAVNVVVSARIPYTYRTGLPCCSFSSLILLLCQVDNVAALSTTVGSPAIYIIYTSSSTCVSCCHTSDFTAYSGSGSHFMSSFKMSLVI
jgi:hypothetical protein